MATKDVIKRLQKKTGLSARGLSRVLGMPENCISYYVNGKRKPSISTCYKIIHFAKLHHLEITLDQLLTE